MHEAAREKEQYEKPLLRIVDLVAEEVLGVGCKSVALPASAGIAPPCAAGGCQQDGS